MRVVFLTHNYPREPGDVAGAFLHPLAVAIRERGVDLRVVAPSDRGKGGHDVIDGVPVTRVRYASPEQETLAYTGKMMSALASPSGWAALAGLFSGLRKGARAELEGAAGAVVHAHWWIPAGLAAPPDVPMVLTCHGTDVRLLERFEASIIARGPLRRAKVLTTVSRTLADTLRKQGAPVRDEDIVPMPVTPAERPLTTGGGGIIVLGRLTAQKRVHLAIDAFALMRDRGCTLPLTIVGDGNTRGELETQARTLGIAEAVTFTGGVSPGKIPAMLATSDLCLMPALGEGFGLAAAEALMQGVPVAACRDGGGLLDIVPANGGGRIVEPAASLIADAALALLADPAARSAAATTGADWHRRLDPALVADRCLEWYQRALA